MHPQNIYPLGASERIDSLDVTRGIALFGILLMNITAFGMDYHAYSDPTVAGGADGLNLYAWVTTNMFFEGTMRGLFSMLFGVGMVVMTTRMEKKGAGVEVADIYYRRTLWLLVFGVIHAYLLLWFGEILFAYAVFGLIIFVFRHAAPRKLITGAVALMVFGSMLSYYQYHELMKKYEKFSEAQAYAEGQSLPDEIKEGKEAWEGMVANMKPDEKKKERFAAEMRKGYLPVMLHLAPINRLSQTVFNYDYNPWDVLPMMLLGIALFRLRVVTAALSYRTYVIMALTGYVIGLAVNYYETTTLLNADFSVLAIIKTNLTYPLGRLGMIFGHLGLIMIWCKLPYLTLLKNALGAVGKMALTNYIMHSIICAIVFTGVGFSMFGRLQRYELYYVVFGIWLFQLILSPVWLRFFQFGPLEWLWRTLTYGQRQPMRRRKAEPALAPVHL